MPVTIEQLHTELQSLKLKFTDLETRIMAVELKAANDKKEQQEQMNTMHQMWAKAVDKLAGLESLEDANFMAVTHMLGVIARALKIPQRDLKTGDRRSTGRKGG